MFLRIIFLLIFIPGSVAGAQINGVVTDAATGKPLEGVTIFINKTTSLATSNEIGEFEIQTSLEGFVEVVMFKEGYELYRSRIRLIMDRQYKLALKLTHLASKSKNASVPGTVTPVTISNDSLGLVHVVYLPGITSHPDEDSPGWFDFKTSTDVSVSIEWESNRRDIYRGSTRHFLSALATNKLKENGYTIDDDASAALSAQLKIPGSSGAYQRMTIDQSIVVKFANGNGSVESSTITTDGPMDFNENGMLIDPKRLKVTGPMKDLSSANNIPIDYTPIEGDIRQVYRNKLYSYFEKIYVHTDKPYYYPGESIWFKTYVNLFKPAFRDSLSTTLYVELFDPSGKRSTSIMLPLDSGLSVGQMQLGDSLAAGSYQLRAFTQLQNNFGNESLYVKPIHILDKYTRPVVSSTAESTTSNGISVVADARGYAARQPIHLKITVTDKKGALTGANLSISVTDASQVVDIGQQEEITSRYPIQKSEVENISEFKYPVEHGITFKGKYLKSKNKQKPQGGLLNVIQLKPYKHFVVDASDDGEFVISDLQFFDSVSFSVFPQDAKPGGKVASIPRYEPPFVNRAFEPLKTVTVGTVQRIISEYEVPKGVRVLDEVEISASKFDDAKESDPEYRLKRPYGRGDYVLTSKDFSSSYGRLSTAIVGKVPGLLPSMIFRRAESSTMFGSVQPLITIDNVPISGQSAMEILDQIDPNTVESIEFTSRLNVLYGSEGRNGVIAIYTKKTPESIYTPQSPVSNLVIPGYNRPRQFAGPDYNDPSTDKSIADYRSTIYWNPDVKVPTGTTTLSFYSSDLPERYRVVVEGINSEGDPVRAVMYLSGKGN